MIIIKITVHGGFRDTKEARKGPSVVQGGGGSGGGVLVADGKSCCSWVWC